MRWGYSRRIHERPLAPALLAPARAERAVDDRQGVLARDVADFADTQHALQLLHRHFERAGAGPDTRCGLREGGGPRGVEREVALDLLHDLVDVAVQDRDGSETFEIPQGLRPVVGDPAPLR